MRPGDERHHSYSGCSEVKFIIENGKTIAGPLKTKKLLFDWLEGFISLYAYKRSHNKTYIPDKIKFSDTNTIYF